MKNFRVEVSDLQNVTSTTIQMLYIGARGGLAYAHEISDLDGFKTDAKGNGMVELFFSGDIRKTFDQTEEVVNFFKINDVESTVFEIHSVWEKESDKYVTSFLKPRFNQY
jgi:hypothetical protein